MPPSCVERIPAGLPVRPPVDGEDAFSGYPFMAAFALPISAQLPPPADPRTVERLREDLAAALSPVRGREQHPRDQLPGQRQTAEAGRRSYLTQQRDAGGGPLDRSSLQERPAHEEFLDDLDIPPALLQSVAAALAQGIGAALALNSRRSVIQQH